MIKVSILFAVVIHCLCALFAKLQFGWDEYRLIPKLLERLCC